MDIPRNKDFPSNAVQCGGCGGHGCSICGDNGWLPDGHPHGRLCENEVCMNPIPPSQLAIYCSNECAADDAQ